MSIKKELKTSDILANIIIEGMREVKAKEIVSLDLRKIETSVCDFFIICHGTSNTHASAIAWHKEGLTNRDWILLDYGNVVAHIFQKEIRDHYNIEKLWGDADVQLIKETA